MSHKYYDDLGCTEGNKTCLFNTDEQDSEERQAWFDEQRATYGFDERETWALDFTASTWLHSHLMMFKEVGEKIVNFDYHKFDIPVMVDNPDYDKHKPSSLDNEPLIEVTENHTQSECIEIMIDYLERYIKDPHFDDEFKDSMYAQCAFKIFSVVFPAMWW